MVDEASNNAPEMEKDKFWPVVDMNKINSTKQTDGMT